jgi:hypothetical protein
MMIAAGWCITREWAQLQKKHLLFLFPLGNFATSLAVDYILESEVGLEAEAGDQPIYIVKDWKRGLYLFLDFVRLLTLFYGWWWMFVSLSGEKKTLQERVAARVDAARAPPAMADATWNPDGNGGTAGGLASDSTATAPAPATAPLGDGAKDSPEAAAISVTTTDAAAGPAGDAEAAAATDDLLDGSLMPDRAKFRLLRQFTWLVQIYLAAVVVVIVYRAWRHETTPALAITLDMLELLALLGLAITFRLRPANPYFMLNDFDAAEGGMELLPTTKRSGLTTSGSAGAAAATTTPFAIDDDDDEEENIAIHGRELHHSSTA